LMVNQLFTQMDVNTTALAVVSESGMAPVYTQVNLNRWLVERKWLTLLRDNSIDLTKSKAYAETSGGLAHIYLSLKGRDLNGSVDPVEVEKLLTDMTAALKDLNDPADGRPIFARVLRRSELGALGLQSDNSGDLVVQARIGYGLQGTLTHTTVFEPAL